MAPVRLDRCDGIADRSWGRRSCRHLHPDRHCRPRQHEHPGRDQQSATASEPAPAAKTRGLQAERLGGGVAEGGRAFVAVLLLLGERAGEDGVEARIGGKRGRRLLHVRPQKLGFRRAVEGRLPLEALVQDAGERVLVRAPVDLFASDLLGGEVVEGADELPRLRRGPPDLLGQPEVGQIGLPRLVQEHVGGLHVAVHETAAMGGIERFGDLAADAQCALGRELALPAQERLQVLALDVARGQVQLSCLLAGGKHGQHVWVVERGCEARLLEEALAKALVGGELGGDQLERHRALEREIACPVDDPHAAAADLRVDPVAGEGRAGLKLGRGHRAAAEVSDQVKCVRVLLGARRRGAARAGQRLWVRED